MDPTWTHLESIKACKFFHIDQMSSDIFKLISLTEKNEKCTGKFQKAQFLKYFVPVFTTSHSQGMIRIRPAGLDPTGSAILGTGKNLQIILDAKDYKGNVW